jgi:DNA polymerase III delta subunit
MKPAPAPVRQSRMLDPQALIAQLEAGRFPSSLYLDGPDEPLKAALLAEIRVAWARHCPDAPLARVFRAGENTVEEILAAYQGASLFTPRELLIVLDVEGLGRSERNVHALAEGLAHPAGESCLVLVESAAESSRKTLEPLRAACAVRLLALPLRRADLMAWGKRRLARERIEAEDGLLAMLVEACESDPAEFFNELEKLATCAGPEGRLTKAEAATLLRPVVGSDLIEYLSAVAAGDPAIAARRLGRVLASGVGEGSVLFALVNLVGGALGGWARWRELSIALSRRSRPADLARALDALYRGEAAWKQGRADAVAVLEQATRVVSGETYGARVPRQQLAGKT